VTEGVNTNATFTVFRSSGTNSPPATIRFETHAGTARPGEDYVETTATLQFATGENSKTISIPILDDNLSEGVESFGVSLSAESADAKLGARIVAQVNITDDDRPLEFTQNTLYSSETSTNVLLTVARAGTSSDHVTGSTELGLKHADLILVDDRIPGAADQTFVPFLNFYHPESSPYGLPLHGLAVQPNGQILFAGNYLPIDSNGTVASLIRLNLCRCLHRGTETWPSCLPPAPLCSDCFLSAGFRQIGP
jgi:hypothetical protein